MDVLMTHGGEELHVLLHLRLVLRFGGAEFEVDHHPLVTICHHTIRATLLDLTFFDGENSALVEERPTR